MSSLYAKSSKRSGEGADRLVWVNEKGSDELKGEAVTGYDRNVPLARGEDRTAERVGEGEEHRGGREKRLFLAAMLASASLDSSIYELRITRVIKKRKIRSL